MEGSFWKSFELFVCIYDEGKTYHGKTNIACLRRYKLPVVAHRPQTFEEGGCFKIVCLPSPLANGQARPSLLPCRKGRALSAVQLHCKPLGKLTPFPPCLQISHSKIARSVVGCGLFPSKSRQFVPLPPLLFPSSFYFPRDTPCPFHRLRPTAAPAGRQTPGLRSLIPPYATETK